MATIPEYISGRVCAKDMSAIELNRVIWDYPWFTTARILRMALQKKHDPALAASQIRKPFPIALLQYCTKDEIQGEAADTVSISCYDKNPDTINIIDTFLRRGDYRIVPGEATPDVDLSARGGDDSELASEELADIYIRQGLFERAEKIYRRLSLLNPEKSIYFAKLIEDLHSKQKK